MKLSTESEKNRLCLRRLEESRTNPARIVTDLSRKNRAGMGTRRRQQQRRASACISHWLNPWVRNRARARLACVFHLDEIRHAEACDVHRCAVIPIPIVVTGVTVHPAPPFHGDFSIGWRTVRFGRVLESRKGMTGCTCLLRVEPQANEMALVPKESPNFPAYG